ncbi:MAG: S-layer homology domain-containing protein [Oscillospiraceae bacterium]|nr:S-layer homology domain-containing protein [Oscillospiraceae bacterium]
MKKIILWVCLMAILILSATIPVSACWMPSVPFEILSEDGSRVFVFDPNQSGSTTAYAAVYEIDAHERQRLYVVEDLASFAYESGFYFSSDMMHFIRIFPAPGMSAFEVFSYGVRTRVVQRRDFIEDYESADHTLSIGPLFSVGWQIERPFLNEHTTKISTGEGNSFVFDVATAEFIGDALPVRAQNAQGTPSSWAQESIERAGELGLLPDAFRFGLGSSTTRAEFAAIAIALYEHFRTPITGRVSFTDTTDTHVEQAAYLGIVSGVGNNRFDPNAPITREQAAVMLDRLAGLFGLHAHNVFPRFDDNQDISDWAILAVGHMQAREIMGGTGNNMFSPGDAYTREQSIVTILRLFELIQESPF